MSQKILRIIFSLYSHGVCTTELIQRILFKKISFEISTYFLAILRENSEIENVEIWQSESKFVANNLKKYFNNV